MNQNAFRVILLSGIMVFPSSAAEVKPADASNGFAFHLFSKLAAKKENTAFSPFSIWTALTFASAGAEKQTLEEMRKVLELPANDSIHALAGEWARKLETSKDIVLRVANRLWVKQGLNLTPEFSKIAKDDYGSGVQQMDFAGKTDACRKEINAWVAEKTEQRIKDLLQPEDVMGDTRLVLTNAVYFKARWLSPFEGRLTSKKPFHKESGGDVQVDMMHDHGHVQYTDTDWGQAVMLPYRGSQTSMVVALPKKGATIATVLAKLNAERFANLIKGMASKETFLQIPRFQSEARMELGDILGALGTKRAFTDNAEFGRMTRDEPLKISKVIHKAFVKVAEEGTEAAAATAITMMPAGAKMPSEKPKEFIADHPFLYFIIDNSSGGILFAGMVMEPNWK